jgi:hypothetical protein
MKFRGLHNINYQNDEATLKQQCKFKKSTETACNLSNIIYAQLYQNYIKHQNQSISKLQNQNQSKHQIQSISKPQNKKHSHFIEAKQRTEKVSMIRGAFTPSTNSRHMGTLKDVSDFIRYQRSLSCPPTTEHRGLNVGTVSPQEVEEYLWHRKLSPQGRTKRGELKWSTTKTLYGTILGSIKTARLYNLDVTADLSDPGWKRIDRFLQKKAYSEIVDFPAAMSVREARLCMASFTGPMSQWLSVYFILWWITAARPGDAVLLVWRNVVVNGDRVSVKFVEGKGVTIRGPYTVHTYCPRQWLQHLSTRKGDPVVPPLIREAVRAQTLRQMKYLNPSLEARSVRRGALQALAMTGATDETLLSFSGHKSAQMLYRYLDWGSRRLKGSREGFEAGRAVWEKPETDGPESRTN